MRHAARPSSIAVAYKTELCDAKGRVIRELQRGHNTITDFGMDSLATLRQDQLVNYLHLSDTTGPGERALSGGTTLTLTLTSPTNIGVAASAGFFLVGDVGKTLSIDDLGGVGQTQELKITAFTDSQHVTCSTRPGVWLPGFTPGTGPFGTAGVHPTDTIVLANQFSKFNTYDNTSSHFDDERNDSGNSRSIHQRVYLSAINSGSTWTIRELGWSDGNAGNNVFGRVNLGSPDVVANGNRYRVTLQLFSGYTPIEIPSQSVNWGATIGTYDLYLRQEIVPFDTNDSFAQGFNFLRPKEPADKFATAWFTNTFTLNAVKWQDDSGYNEILRSGGNATGELSVDGSYTNGSHTKTRLVKWPDTVVITGATGLTVYGDTNNVNRATLALKPNTGTIDKPAGFWAALTFDLYWTRSFTN